LLTFCLAVVNRTSGAALDKSIHDCMEALSRRPAGYGGWLIILSDMYGANARARHGKIAREQLEGSGSDMNFVFINSWKTGGYWNGNKPPAETEVVASYIKAAGSYVHAQSAVAGDSLAVADRLLVITGRGTS
jgi:hypothetical protein